MLTGSKKVQTNPPGMITEESSLFMIVRPPTKLTQPSVATETLAQVPPKPGAVHSVTSGATRIFRGPAATNRAAKEAARVVPMRLTENILIEGESR